MKSTTIAYTNSKGQLVIPKEFRNNLDIDESVALLVKLTGKSIIISPIESVQTMMDKEESYIDILRKTKGKWGEIDELNAVKRKLELKGSKERKELW